jgi:RNA polymerase sigma factor (sigma-70 family)
VAFSALSAAGGWRPAEKAAKAATVSADAEPPSVTPGAEEEASLLAGYARTRKSLIEKLHNWEDQKVWDEFYRTYWRLIYSVGLKSGLRSEEAMDMVQEVVLAIAKQSQKQQYDPKNGSFKSWLLNLTRWRINDQFRRRSKDTAMSHGGDHSSRDTATMDRFEGDGMERLEKVWDLEWKRNILDQALARVKVQVSPLQYQIFDCYVVKDWSVGKVRKELGVSIAQVYLAKHRVGKIFESELQTIEKFRT